ncbi:MAG TPA: SpoIIE family protein phosphatase [Terracidiphilus sp.]|nr:SpoIIE family protein phosphatase [Terracidiphilus sp.]
MRKLALLLLFWTTPLAAQTTVSISAWPNGSQALNQGWRMHAGDNPAWAQPAFDDTAWPSISFGAQYDDGAGWRWYRLRVHLPASHPPIALLVTGGDGAYEVYANGQQMPGPELKSSLRVTLPQEELIALPNLFGDVEIAIRTDIPPTSMFVADRGAWRVRIGTLPAIEEARRAARGERLNASWPGTSIDALLFLSAIPLLFLFWRQRNHREYLWLGLYLIAVSTGDAAFELTLNGYMPFSVNWFWGDPTGYLSLVALIEFTFSFVGKRVTGLWRFYEALLVALILCLNLPAWFGLISRGFINLVESVLMVPGSVALFVLLLIWYRRGFRETTWLILPIFLAAFSLGVIDLGIAASYMGWSRLVWLGDPMTFWGFPMLTLDPANLLFLLAIGIVMFFRFTRVSDQQARAAAELDAAREIQQYLIPSKLPETPGLAIQSVYQPSREVGGDFFQVLPDSRDGSALIVVGDVAGKGLQAGMLAALIIGAIRMAAKFTTEPTEILALLNERLQGRGLVTCLALRIAPDGVASVANAGHLPPYLNGSDLPVEGSMPLGAVSGIDFPVMRFNLAVGDNLTIVSDGVVEAQSPTGELFGFDRTRQISTQSAEAIAAAAQQFGQEDDITVLTLDFAPAEVLHA